ncbi:MAG: asparagine synthase-related protein [Gemmatimonadaceae bacterium]
MPCVEPFTLAITHHWGWPHTFVRTTAKSLGFRWRRACSLNASVVSPRAGFSQTRLSARNILAEYLAYDLENQFTGEYLTKVDGASMFYGLETRSPLLDHELWEYVSALPSKVRLHTGVLRYPPGDRTLTGLGRVASGRKRGFTVPMERWVRGPWLGEMRSRLLDGPLCTDGWIARRPLERLLASPRDDVLGVHHLWYLAVLNAWFVREEARHRDFHGANAANGLPRSVTCWRSPFTATQVPAARLGGHDWICPLNYRHVRPAGRPSQ